jgi:hypothetical protein
MMQIDHVSPLYYPVFISIKYLLAIQNYNFKRVPFGHITLNQSEPIFAHSLMMDT